MHLTDILAREIAKGKWHFILVRGILGYGLLLALICNAVMFAAVDEWTAQGVVLSFLVFPIVGALWGAFTWWWIKRCLRCRRPHDLSEGNA